MPYTSMPAWPNFTDQEVSDLAYFLTTFSPDFANPGTCRPARAAPERAGRHDRVHRAREEAVRGDRLPEVPRQPRSGRRTVGAHAGGRLQAPDTRGRPRAPLDLPGRVVPRGHLPDDEHGVQRHADAVVHRQPLDRATLGDHRLHRLSLEERRAWLYQPRRRQARPWIRSIWRRGPHSSSPLLSPAFRSSDRSWSPARVPSADHLRDRSGHLRCRIDCPARSLARHERGEDGNERAVASRAAGGGGGAGAPRRRRAPENPFGDQEVAAARQPRIPLPRRTRRPPAPIRVLRRRRRSRFLRRCRPAPASPTSSSATARTPWISGSSIWPAPIPFSSPAGAARTSPPTTPGMSPVSPATTRANGRSSSSGRFAPARAPRSRPETFLPIAFSVWDGFSRERGNRRGLTAWYSLYVEPEVVTSAVGPMVRTALLILVIELAVIGWVRWRHGSRARGELGGEPSHPAATRA